MVTRQLYYSKIGGEGHLSEPRLRELIEVFKAEIIASQQKAEQ